MEKNFSREPGPGLSRKNSYSARKNSVEKNYYEWKPKAGNDIWAETLRGRNNSIKNTEKKDRKEEESKNLENQLELTKEKLKNSIKILLPNLSLNNLNLEQSNNNINNNNVSNNNSLILNRSQSTKNFGRNYANNNNNLINNSSSKILNFNNVENNNNINNNIPQSASNRKNNNNNNQNEFYLNSGNKNKFNLQFGLSGISKSNSDRDFEYSNSPNRSNREKNMGKKRIIKQM